MTIPGDMLSRFSSQAALLGRLIRLNFGRPAHPLKISYAVTYRCNLRCRMCNIWRSPQPQPELTPEQASRFFSGADRFVWIGFTGGEPFLRGDLFDLISAAVRPSRRLFGIHVNTNGWLTERIPAVAERLVTAFPGLQLVVTVSLDGPPAIHDDIRGIPGTWSRAMNTFRSLKGLGRVKAQLGYTISHRNLGAFDDALESVREVYPPLRFDDLNVNVFHRSRHYYGNEQMDPLPADAVAREIGSILSADNDRPSANNFLRRRYLKLYLRYLDSGRPPLPCQALAASCFLDPAGHLYPCSIHGSRVASVGDSPPPLGELWRSSEVRRLAECCARHQCPTCWSPCEAFISITGSLAQSVFA